MFIYKNSVYSIFLVAFVVLVLSLEAWGAQTGRHGGVLRIAATGEPATLDSMTTSSSPVGEFSKHIFETPFAFDAEYRPVPFLVESYNFEDSGKLLKMRLRKGVKFHNGDEMTSADFVASMNRWGNHSAKGKNVFEYVDKVVANGTYAVEVRLSEPFSPILTYLARSRHACIIVPAKIAKKYKASPIKRSDYIGTGPYKFNKWAPGDYISIVRFDDYTSHDDPADGYAGKRTAYFDEIRLLPVKEMGTRLSGLEVQEFDFVTRIKADHFPQVKLMPVANPFKYVFPGYNLLYFNLDKGVANLELRRAILASLDMDPIMIATYADPEFYDKSGAYYPEGTLWHTNAGTELYDQNALGKAKKLMKKAGYSNEPLRYVTTKQFGAHYDQGVIITDQLRKAGFNIDLKLHDWPTVRQKIENPDEWDMFFTRSIIEPEPLAMSLFVYPGWWDTGGKNKYMQALARETEPKARAKAWENLQLLMYEEIPWILTGKHFFTGAVSTKLRAVDPAFSWRANSWVFWNAWFAE